METATAFDGTGGATVHIGEPDGELGIDLRLGLGSACMRRGDLGCEPRVVTVVETVVTGALIFVPVPVHVPVPVPLLALVRMLEERVVIGTIDAGGDSRTRLVASSVDTHRWPNDRLFDAMLSVGVAPGAVTYLCSCAHALVIVSIMSCLRGYEYEIVVCCVCL